MNKLLLTTLLVGSFYLGHSQVGVGTTTPQGAFEVVSTTDGLLIPRVALTNTTTATILTPTKSEMVYNTATAGDVTPGYYYWETTPTVASDRWVRLSSTTAGTDWAVTGNAGTNPATNFAGTTDAQDFAIRTNNTERARITSTGSMGIGTNAPNGALDINSSTQGMVPPRVALTSTAIEAPVVNPAGGSLVAGTLVWNTNTNSPTIATAVAPGMYYWNGTRWISLAGSPGGLDWSIIGNGGIDGGTVTAGGAHFLGTYDNTNMDIRTNGTHRARVSNLGEFFIGAYNTTLPGDLMNGVSEGNVTFPWAVNGYTDQNAAGIYGRVKAGVAATGLFGAVQGEYNGSNARGTGVRGIGFGSTAGTDFVGTFNTGVAGSIQNTVARSFGVGGTIGTNTSRRVGGVIGTDLVASGALGYFTNGGASTSVYGFANNYTNGNATGKSNNTINTTIGLGIYGGVIGGWINGEQYGTVFTGQRFANYNMGKSISNDAYVVLNQKADGSRVASYATTSMSNDITLKGVSKLVNGEAYIAFNKDYTSFINEDKPIIITITPIGESNGIHIVSVDKNGFRIKENKSGTSNVTFNWISIAEKQNSKELPREMLSKDFDKNLMGVMEDENSEKTTAIWSENGEVKFGKSAPVSQEKLSRAKDSNFRKPETKEDTKK